MIESPLCAKVAGFSLHAARIVGASDRDGFEWLCRYGSRAQFSQERLSVRGDGRVAYRLRRPWPNAQGTTCLVLEPLDLLRRLAALVPAPPGKGAAEERSEQESGIESESDDGGRDVSAIAPRPDDTTGRQTVP